MGPLIVSEEKLRLFTYLCDMCEYVNYTDEWRDAFWQELLKNKAVYKEFLYYAEHRDFLLECTVDGNSIVDIFIWEMRKYNVRMDLGRNGSDCDKQAMVLEAFSDMLKECKKGGTLKWSMEMRNGMDEL